MNCITLLRQVWHGVTLCRDSMHNITSGDDLHPSGALQSLLALLTWQKVVEKFIWLLLGLHVLNKNRWSVYIYIYKIYIGVYAYVNENKPAKMVDDMHQTFYMLPLVFICLALVGVFFLRCNTPWLPLAKKIRFKAIHALLFAMVLGRSIWNTLATHLTVSISVYHHGS